MSLREDIWEHLPDNVTDVVVDKDGDIHGLEAVRVTVFYTATDDKKMYMSLNFARKNQMTGDHIGHVVRSYLKNGIASREVD